MNPVDPLEQEIRTFNQRIAAAREKAAADGVEPKVAVVAKPPVWEDETDRLDPLFDAIGTFNETIRAGREKTAAIKATAERIAATAAARKAAS